MEDPFHRHTAYIDKYLHITLDKIPINIIESWLSKSAQVENLTPDNLALRIFRYAAQQNITQLNGGNHADIIENPDLLFSIWQSKLATAIITTKSQFHVNRSKPIKFLNSI